MYENITINFIEKANAVHLSKYNYEKVEYHNSKTKVIITCPVHGDFSQAPKNHLSGQGCRLCSSRKPKLEDSLLSPQEKRRQTCLKRYGVNSPLNFALFKARAVRHRLLSLKPQTQTQKDHLKAKMKSKEIQDKMQKTNMERYGVRNVMQNPEILEKQRKSSFSLKPFLLPSKQLIYVQGYEPFALKSLFTEDTLFGRIFNETEVVVGLSHVPQIRYMLQEKTHIYFPDIYIPTINTVVEVKSVFTFNKSKERNAAKWNAVVEKGHKMVVLVYKRDSTLIEKREITISKEITKL